MCGITGIFSLNGRPIDNAEARIMKMTSMLIHRGPDSQGIYVSNDKNLALGNTRLAIVDPGCAIKQPMESLDRKSVISFNGEIYNYQDVKRDLEGRGVKFRSHMDTEILLEGLRLYGEPLLESADGMWVFAYYEKDKKRLLLSRDIMGERHLFYRIDRNRDEFIFASEMKPIMADARLSFDIDMESLASALRFYSAPPGRTLIKDVHRLMAGHNLAIEQGRKYKIYRYRKLHPEKWVDFFGRKPGLDETMDMYESIFKNVCKRRIPQEVPFICTLSGGIDSALVCLFASEGGKSKIRTLFGHSSDEPVSRPAKELTEYEGSLFTSRKLNTDHAEIRMNNDACIPVLKRLAANGFDGMIDPGVASFEMLAHEVKRQDIKVMLISDGPDELLGGYSIDQKSYRIDKMLIERPALFKLVKSLSSTPLGRFILRLTRGSDCIISPFISYNPLRFDPIHQSHGPGLLSKIVENDIVLSSLAHYGTEGREYDDITPMLDFTQRRALSYASKTLPNHFNLRTDKAFMRASIECRLPHQAPEMVEFMIAMPALFRFGGGDKTKYFLREVVNRHIGPEIAYRSKHGFSTPLWHAPNVYQAMDFENEIRSSRLFDDPPFKPKAKELILKPENKKILWPFLVLSKTHDCLKRGAYE